MAQTILVLGGGYGGLSVALELERELSRGQPRDWDIVLVDRYSYHQHIILLHEVAANSIAPRDAAVSFSRLLEGKRILFKQGLVAGVDVERRSVSVDDGQIHYDLLVVALGSETDYFDIPGLKENSFGLKSIGEAWQLREHIKKLFAQASDTPSEERRAMLTFVVGGGGFTGVEMAGELADWLPELAREHGIPAQQARLILLEASGTILASFGRRPTRIARQKLAAKGVELRIRTPVVRAEAGLAQLGSGEVIPTRTLIWVGGVKAPSQLAQWGLETGARGRAKINEYLQSTNRPEVYLIGDSSLVIEPSTGRPAPPSAQVTLQQASCVARNIAADLGYGQHRSFQFLPTGDVISLGRNDAIATFGPIVFDGYQARLLKETIALRYYNRIGGPGLTLRKLPGSWRATGFGPRALLPGL